MSNNDIERHIDAPHINPFGPNSLLVQERVGAYRGALAAVRAKKVEFRARIEIQRVAEMERGFERRFSAWRSQPEPRSAINEDTVRYISLPGLVTVGEIHEGVFGHSQVAYLGDVLLSQFKHSLVPQLAGISTQGEFPALVVAAWRHAGNLVKSEREPPTIVPFFERMLLIACRFYWYNTALLQLLERKYAAVPTSVAHQGFWKGATNMAMDASFLLGLGFLREDMGWLYEPRQRDLASYHLGVQTSSAAEYSQIYLERMDELMARLKVLAQEQSEGALLSDRCHDELKAVLQLTQDFGGLYFSEERQAGCVGADYNPEGLIDG